MCIICVIQRTQDNKEVQYELPKPSNVGLIQSETASISTRSLPSDMDLWSGHGFHREHDKQTKAIEGYDEE